MASPETISAIGTACGAAFTACGAVFTAWAATEARRAARSAREQSAEAERFQREQAVDAQWMRYQECYGRCIDLFERHPGMPLADYEQLGGADKRRIHIAAMALLQALDLAYRAGDPGRAASIRRFLIDYAGPLLTDGAIRPGALKSTETISAWNEFRRANGLPALLGGYLDLEVGQ